MSVDTAINSYWEGVWIRFQRGDKEAFALLYNLHIDSLFRYGCHLSKDESLVKDAIQEVFIDLYRTREKNKSGPEHLKYYLVLALKRNLIRKLTRQRRVEWGEIKDNYDFEPVYNVETRWIEQERQFEVNQKISEVINSLPAKQKEAIYLKFNESLDYPEIAKIMGITVESVRKQVYRALKQVREMFDIKGLIIFFQFFQKKSK